MTILWPMTHDTSHPHTPHPPTHTRMGYRLYYLVMCPGIAPVVFISMFLALYCCRKNSFNCKTSILCWSRHFLKNCTKFVSIILDVIFLVAKWPYMSVFNFPKISGQVHLTCLRKLTSQALGLYNYNSLMPTKPVNLFPVTSPAMVITITKRTKPSETKREKWEKTLTRPQVVKLTWNIS